MKQLPLPDKTDQTEQPDQQSIAAGNGSFKQMPNHLLKKLAYAGLAIAVCLSIVWAFRPTPIQVDTGKVGRGSLQVTVDAEGKTRVRDRYAITAPANGHLERILLNEGDPVKSGELVARIEPLPLTASVKEALGRLAEWKAQRAGVATQRPKTETLAQAIARIQKAGADRRQAEARVEQAQAALVQAQRDRDRAQQLEATGAIARQNRESAELNATTRAKELEAAKLATQAAASEVEVAKAALAVLQKQQADPDYLLNVYDARIASTEAELSKLRDEANRTDIRSPVEGRVLRILQRSAQFVTDGTPLLELGDVANLELVIDVLSTDAQRIKPGAPILIERTDAQPMRAVVRLVEPAAFTKVSALGVEEQRVNAIGDFVDLPKSFGDAYRVDVKIITWEGKDVLKVPLSALFRCDRGWCAFAVKGDRAQRRSLTIGHRSNFEAEIQTGLTTDEVVILHPNEQINDGTQVSTR
jgi:HlyD family secretion protein